MKSCNRSYCNQKNPQSLHNFSKDKSKSDGYKPSCKGCDTEYRKKNRQVINQKAVLYRQLKKDQRAEYQRLYRKINRDRINAKQKADCEKNPNLKLARNLRRRLHHLITDKCKTGSAVRDLGCSVEELVIKLEKMFYPNPVTEVPMSWENYGYGKNKWQIDHIKPLITFNLENRSELLVACNFTNLQPLWHEDHSIKTTKEIPLKKKS